MRETSYLPHRLSKVGVFIEPHKLINKQDNDRFQRKRKRLPIVEPTPTEILKTLDVNVSKVISTLTPFFVFENIVSIRCVGYWSLSDHWSKREVRTNENHVNIELTKKKLRYLNSLKLTEVGTRVLILRWSSLEHSSIKGHKRKSQ